MMLVSAGHHFLLLSIPVAGHLSKMRTGRQRPSKESIQALPEVSSNPMVPSMAGCCSFSSCPPAPTSEPRTSAVLSFEDSSAAG